VKNLDFKTATRILSLDNLHYDIWFKGQKEQLDLAVFFSQSINILAKCHSQPNSVTLLLYTYVIYTTVYFYIYTLSFENIPALTGAQELPIVHS